MNLALADVHGGVLVVSQFTLYGDVQKGRRPSFIDAAPPSSPSRCTSGSSPCSGSGVRERYPRGNGEFGAMMEVELVNDGPVTLILEK